MGSGPAPWASSCASIWIILSIITSSYIVTQYMTMQFNSQVLNWTVGQEYLISYVSSPGVESTVHVSFVSGPLISNNCHCQMHEVVVIKTGSMLGHHLQHQSSLSNSNI